MIWETADSPVNLCLPPPDHPPTEDTNYKILEQVQTQNTKYWNRNKHKIQIQNTGTSTNTKYKIHIQIQCTLASLTKIRIQMQNLDTKLVNAKNKLSLLTYPFQTYLFNVFSELKERVNLDDRGSACARSVLPKISRFPPGFN